MGSDEAGAAAAKPPGSPLWKDMKSLVPVQQFNERCIELLCSVAKVSEIVPVLRDNAELWTAIDGDARRRLAGMPFVMVDVRFQDDEFWLQVVRTQGREPDVVSEGSRFPEEIAEDLMYETLMFCWQLVSASRDAAMSAFGMSPAVADMIAALKPRDVREIARRQHGAAQVRWELDQGFWHESLRAALDADEGRLAALHLHAKHVLLSELVSTLD